MKYSVRIYDAVYKNPWKMPLYEGNNCEDEIKKVGMR